MLTSTVNINALTNMLMSTVNINALTNMLTSTVNINALTKNAELGYLCSSDIESRPLRESTLGSASFC